MRNAVRVFAVHRFISAHTTDSAAPRRPDLRTKAALAGAFRVWRDETVSQVHLRFFGDITTHVAERVVHKSQRIAWNVAPLVTQADLASQAATVAATKAVPPAASRAADRNSATAPVAPPLAAPASPTLDIHFEVAGTQEVLHWLLGYGAAVQVLAPLSLIEAHQRELSGGLARYPSALAPQPVEYQWLSQPRAAPVPAVPEKNKTLRKPRTSVVRTHR